MRQRLLADRRDSDSQPSCGTAHASTFLCRVAFHARQRHNDEFRRCCRQVRKPRERRFTGIRGRERRTRDEEWMMALERCLHADAGLPGFCTDMVVLGAVGDRGGRGGGRLRRCCSGAEVEQREVMSFNAYGVHTEQMPPSEGADVEGF